MESSSLPKHTVSDMENVVERIPGWALCYIVNGDRDSITDEEIQMVDDFYESYRKGGMEIQGIYPVNDDDENFEAYFSHCPAFGLPCDVVDCDVMYIISNDAKARESKLLPGASVSGLGTQQMKARMRSAMSDLSTNGMPGFIPVLMSLKPERKSWSVGSSSSCISWRDVSKTSMPNPAECSSKDGRSTTVCRLTNGSTTKSGS